MSIHPPRTLGGVFIVRMVFSYRLHLSLVLAVLQVEQRCADDGTHKPAEGTGAHGDEAESDEGVEWEGVHERLDVCHGENLGPACDAEEAGADGGAELPAPAAFAQLKKSVPVENGGWIRAGRCGGSRGGRFGEGGSRSGLCAGESVLGGDCGLAEVWWSCVMEGWRGWEGRHR